MKTKFLFAAAFTLLLFSCNNDNSPEPIQNLTLENLSFLPSNIPQDFYDDLTFTNETTAYAVSRLGKIVKTIDGGTSWDELNSLVAFPLVKVQFVDENIGFVIGGDATGSYLLKTTNAGQTWSVQNLNSELNGAPSSMFFKNQNEGFITGNKLFIKTTNGGQTWTKAITTTDENYKDINFNHNYSLGYVTLNTGDYYKSTNGGNSWQTIDNISDNNYSTIYFVCDKVLFKNNNFVTNLEDNRSISIPSPVSKLLYLNTNKCVGIGQHYEIGFFPYGDILLTNDNWTNFLQKTYQPSSEVMDFTAIAKMSNHKIMILGTGQLGTKIVVLNY